MDKKKKIITLSILSFVVLGILLVVLYITSTPKKNDSNTKNNQKQGTVTLIEGKNKEKEEEIDENTNIDENHENDQEIVEQEAPITPEEILENIDLDELYDPENKFSGNPAGNVEARYTVEPSQIEEFEEKQKLLSEEKKHGVQIPLVYYVNLDEENSMIQNCLNGNSPICLSKTSFNATAIVLNTNDISKTEIASFTIYSRKDKDTVWQDWKEVGNIPFSKDYVAYDFIEFEPDVTKYQIKLVATASKAEYLSNVLSIEKETKE